jgi:hypothetical protein
MAEPWEIFAAETRAEMEDLSDSALASYLAHADVMRNMSVQVPEHFKTRTDVKVPYAEEEYQKRKERGNTNLRDLYYNAGKDLLDKGRTVEQPYIRDVPSGERGIDTAHRRFLQSFGPPMPRSFVESVEDAFPSYGENEQNYAYGGPVMPGLGFRPLGYFEGGTADLIVQFNNLFSQNKIGEVIDLVNNNQEVFFSGDKINPGLHPNVADIINNLINLDYLTPPPIAEEISDLGGITTSDMLQLPLGGYEVTGPTDEVFPSSLGEQRFRENVGDITYGGEVSASPPYVGPGLGGEETPVDITKTWEQLYSPQEGSLIPQFQTGGYADNSRGTVAGELPRYGHMSVREEGETMAELSKRHREQDWYSKDKMGGGLGSLGPLRRDRRRA